MQSDGPIPSLGDLRHSTPWAWRASAVSTTPRWLVPSRSADVLTPGHDCNGAIVFKHACALGCEGIVSKRLGSPYRSGRVEHWLKIKNPAAPAVKREMEEDWGNKRQSRWR
jgi:hypothetical protein